METPISDQAFAESLRIAGTAKIKSGKGGAANSPCMDGQGFVSHDVSLTETKRGPRWKCRKCGKVLE